MATTKSAEAPPLQRTSGTAYVIQMKIMLLMTENHFSMRGFFDDKRMAQALDAGKQILTASQKLAPVREALGSSHDFWTHCTAVFSRAVPILEEQSFAPPEPGEPASDAQALSSSSLIAANFINLLKDIERLNDVLIISRNALATREVAQDLAAKADFDKQVLKLINVCVRVTASGYDGEAGTRNEEKWQRVINAYKKLLITCLQFLHNFVMHNERRKLLLWLDLFGNSPTFDSYLVNSVDPASNKVEPISQTQELQSSVNVFINSLLNNPDGIAHIKDQIMSPPGKDEVERIQKDVKDLAINTAGEPGKERLRSASEPPPVNTATQTTNGEGSSGQKGPPQPNTSGPFLDDNDGPVTDEDTLMSRTPQSAAQTLKVAKDQLMTRLHEDPVLGSEDNYDGSEIGDENDDGEDGDIEGSDIAADGDDEDDDDYYHRPGDQARGLLTDIPLVLGPNEIEALPMLIQSGIVNLYATSRNPNPQEMKLAKSMQAVRCNILLAQESGRNLLRELLIFIAAWDLPDEEIYFKMMMQIMEAILANGLMPFAYQTFGEVKDIISPAQAVVVKLLTQIFRVKQSHPNTPAPLTIKPTSGPTRNDVLMVKYLFTVFRQSIIPETCALIYLQGQIRQGAAHPEDFPLNLWDMERVYEGIYQFLEFFAVLTESESWKALLIKWELVSELITLLRELDTSIPKGSLDSRASSIPSGQVESTAILSDSEPGSAPLPAPTPVAVERPYDPSTSPPESPSPPSAPPLSAEDPSRFEWRNLKKLVVLVLSSLVWKSAIVQDQIRNYGGIEQILACTNFDAHNPYIREHAIMCLRFLLEGNRENQTVVRELEARVAVPSEVLDKRGYETFIDERGKVGLRRKEGAVAVASVEQEKVPVKGIGKAA